MATLEEKRAGRLKFMNGLYEKTGGARNMIVNMWALGRDLGLTEELTRDAYDYLSGEGLLKATTLGGGLGITQAGVKAVEDAITHPNQPTTFFPAAGNVINIGAMVNSTIQQGNHGSTQSVQIQQASAADINHVLDEIRVAYDQLNLTANTLNELKAEVDTIFSQLKSPKPKTSIVKECLGSVRKILESATGAVAGKLLGAVIGLSA